MSVIPIPDGLIGRPGMVAILQRVSPASNGRLVAVRHAVGPISSLGTSPRPIFAWQVLVLGDPIDVEGKPSREIVVADPCLKPVSQIDVGEVEKLARAQAQEDFDAALADLHRILERNPMSEEELDAALNQAKDTVGISKALEVVPTATALRELGFRPSHPKSDTALHWSGMHQGRELYVMAGPDMFGNWTITGTSSTPREKMWNERVVLGDEPRGKLAKHVVDLWREAFGKEAPVPSSLELGLIYEQHQVDIRSLDIGLRRLYLDGEIFRATKKWLAQRHGYEHATARRGHEATAKLSVDRRLLRIEVDTEVYACPAGGVWVDDCAMALADLLAAPPSSLRGRTLVLERSLNSLNLNGHAIPLLGELDNRTPSRGASSS